MKTPRPRLLDLAPQRRDRLLVVLRQFEGRVHLRRVVDDLIVEILDLLDELALVVMRSH